MSRLVLSRKRGEEIVIRDAQGQELARVHVVSGGRVKLAVDADRDLQVLRGELAVRNDEVAA